MTRHPDGVGRSSFEFIDTGKLFSLLGLQEGAVLVDLGCGPGNYSLAASEYVGSKGRVYAVDRWAQGLDHLKDSIQDRGIENISVMLADIGKTIPVQDDCVDVCLVAGVFHHLVDEGAHEQTLREIKRTLKQDGVLAIIEFKKKEGPPGPPISMRISPEALEDMLTPPGFLKKAVSGLGPDHYLALFCNSIGC